MSDHDDQQPSDDIRGTPEPDRPDTGEEGGAAGADPKPPPKKTATSKTLLGMPAPGGIAPPGGAGSPGAPAKPGAGGKPPAEEPVPAPGSAAANEPAGKPGKPPGKRPRRHQATLMGMAAPPSARGGAAKPPVDPTAPPATPAAISGGEPTTGEPDEGAHERPTPVAGTPRAMLEAAGAAKRKPAPAEPEDLEDEQTRRAGPGGGGGDPERGEGATDGGGAEGAAGEPPIVDESPPADEGTQEITVEDVIAAESPPPPPGGRDEGAGQAAPRPSVSATAPTMLGMESPVAGQAPAEQPSREPQTGDIAEPVAAPSGEVRPEGSRKLLIAGAALALLAAVGLGIYAATRGDAAPEELARIDEAQAAGAAPEAVAGRAEAPTTTAEGDEATAEPGASEEAGEAGGDEGAEAAEAGAEGEPAAEDEAPADEARAGPPGAAAAAAIELPEVPASIERLPARTRAKRAARLRSAARRLFRRKRYDRAAELFRKSLQFHPDSAATAMGLALVYERQEEHGKAIGWLHRAIEIDPDEANYHYLLGTVLEETGDVDGARAALEKAAELDPRDKRIRRRLKKVGAQN